MWEKVTRRGICVNPSANTARFAIALRGQAKNSTDLRDICVRSDKLSQTPLKVLVKTPLGNIFCGGMAKRFKHIYTGGQSLISLLNTA